MDTLVLNRAQRRAAKRVKKPQRGAGHFALPITIRFSAEEETALMQQPAQAAISIRDGTATEGDWHELMLRLNWGRLLNLANFEEGQAHLKAAQAAAAAIKDRFDKYGSWSMSTPEREAIDYALALCCQMQKACTRRELRQSLQAVYIANDYHKKVEALKNKLDAQAI